MTGAYLRVLREGLWIPVEIEHLTSEERKNHFSQRDKAEILRWMDMLCETISSLEEMPK